MSDITYEDIDQLIKSGFDINSKDANGFTLLHELTKEGNLNGVRSLLEHEVDFNAVDKKNRSSLHFAIMYKHTKIAKLLINKCTEIDFKDNAGLTPLHLAALQDNIDLLYLLVIKSTDINAQTVQEGYTPLHIAALYGSKKSVQILVNQGANIESKDNNFYTPLLAAISEYSTNCSRRIEIIKYLIKKGANVEARDAENNTTFFLLAYNNQTQVLKLLTRKLKRNNKTQFYKCIRIKNNQGFDPLDCAIENDNEKMVKFFISKGIEVTDRDLNNNTRLHKVSYNGNIEAVRLLLKLKTKVDAITKCGRTALHLATKRGHTRIIKMLLDAGANINVQDSHGYIPLHIAIQKNYFYIAQILITHGSDLNIKCNNHYTPLEMFIDQSEDRQENSRRFCRFLLFHLKEQHNRCKNYCILSCIILSITIIGLPFVFRSVIKYRKKSKEYRQMRTILENWFCFHH